MRVFCGNREFNKICHFIINSNTHTCHSHRHHTLCSKIQWHFLLLAVYPFLKAKLKQTKCAHTCILVRFSQKESVHRERDENELEKKKNWCDKFPFLKYRKCWKLSKATNKHGKRPRWTASTTKYTKIQFYRKTGEEKNPRTRYASKHGTVVAYCDTVQRTNGKNWQPFGGEQNVRNGIEVQNRHLRQCTVCLV